MKAADMSYPARCRHCGHVHDAGKVETVQRYADCSVWRCPNCQVLIDDRPVSWGGSMVGQDVVRFEERWVDLDGVTWGQP